MRGAGAADALDLLPQPAAGTQEPDVEGEGLTGPAFHS